LGKGLKVPRYSFIALCTWYYSKNPGGYHEVKRTDSNTFDISDTHYFVDALFRGFEKPYSERNGGGDAQSHHYDEPWIHDGDEWVEPRYDLGVKDIP
jgi:hypothetical protein